MGEIRSGIIIRSFAIACKNFEIECKDLLSSFINYKLTFWEAMFQSNFYKIVFNQVKIQKKIMNKILVKTSSVELCK